MAAELKRGARLALVVLTGLNLLNYFDRYVLAAVLPKLQVDLQLSNFEAGLAGGAFMLGYCAFSPLFGWLGDRRPRRLLIATAVGLWSVATAGASLARGFGSLFGLRTFVGVGEAGYATLSPTLIDDFAPPGGTNRWLSVFYVAIPVGSAMGYALGGAMEHAWGWRLAFLAAGIPGLLLAASVMALREPARSASSKDGAKGYGQLLRLPVYVTLVLGLAAYTFAIGGFAFWAPKYVVDRFAMPLGRADLLFGAVTASAGIVGTLLGGYLGERWPGRTLLARLLFFSGASSLLAAPAAAVALLWPTVAGPLPFFIWLGVAELFLFASTSPINTAILHAVPEGMRAGAMAASILAMHVGGDLLSPPLIGLFADRLGMRLALSALPVAIALSFVFWIWAGQLARGEREPSAG